MDAIHNKLLTRGVGSLTDAELVSLVIDDASEASVARSERIIAECGSISGLRRVEVSRLRMVEGVGLKRACRIVAAAELGSRMAMAQTEQVTVIESFADVLKIFRPLLGELQHEECWVLYLSNGNRIIERQKVGQGGVQAALVDHRLIAKRALELLATQVVMVHNHPSGCAEASQQDRVLTKRVSEALALFDIKLLDHLIIAREGFVSLRDEGVIK